MSFLVKRAGFEVEEVLRIVRLPSLRGARLLALPPERKLEIARAGAKARWSRADGNRGLAFADERVTEFFRANLPKLAAMTEVHQRVAALRAGGRVTTQIATELGLPPKQVKQIFYEIKRFVEVGARSRTYKCGRCGGTGHNSRRCEAIRQATGDRQQATGEKHPNDVLVVEHAAWADKYARTLAKKYPGMDPDEAAGEAAMRLLLAARKFDPEKSNNFKAWATVHIKGAVVDAHRRNDPAGRWQREKEKQGIETTAARRGIPMRIWGDVSDLEKDHPDRGLFFSRPASQVVHAELAEMLELLEKLPPNQARVMREHHIEGKTLARVGREVGVTESRACQIETEARQSLMVLISEPSSRAA